MTPTAGAPRRRGGAAHVPPTASEATPTPSGHPDRHPARRRAVEAAHGRFNRFRRLPTRTEQRAGHDPGVGHLAAALTIYRKVRHARLLSG